MAKTIDKVIDKTLESALVGLMLLLISASSGLLANTRALHCGVKAYIYSRQENAELSNEYHEKMRYWSNVAKYISVPARYVFGIGWKEVK